MKTEPKKPVYLVLNCSEAVLQVVLGTSRDVLWSLNIQTPGRAMRHIAPAIQAGLNSLELRPRDLSGISCVEGPGSFTGIRMIFAHASGLSRAAGIPMSAVSSFDALILGPGRLLQGTAWIFIHSRLGRVYAGSYCLPDLKPLYFPADMAVQDIPELISSDQDREIYVLGSGVRKNPDFFKAQSCTVLPACWDIPLAHSLLELGVNAAYTHDNLCPTYLRLSNAEENLRKNQKTS
ncbi:MAG: tRNA (adenosine(37)-N6)-threonylcarbamoyltransferase complex dimerization subunit type 1 TsaB [Desulfonatronovibrio sp.]